MIIIILMEQQHSRSTLANPGLPQDHDVWWFAIPPKGWQRSLRKTRQWFANGD